MNEHPQHPPAFLSRQPELLREHVITLRKLLLANDYQPVAVATGPKNPIEVDWQLKRGLPPFNAGTSSTGILCRTLRAFDVDIDDPEKAAITQDIIERHFGPAPTRTRPNSPRFSMLYRAAEDEPPPKHVIFVNGGKVEILGDGQQTMVDGEHPDGGAYQWLGASPLNTPFEDLRAITEEQIAAVEDELLVVLGAEPAKLNGGEREGGAGREPGEVSGETTLDDIVAALDALPADYPRDMRVKIGMAAYAGSGGAGIVFEAFRRWREGHGDAVPPGAIAAAWRSFARTRSVTVATLFGEVLNRIPEWRKPSAIAAAEARAREKGGGGGGGTGGGGDEELPEADDDPGRSELPSDLDLTDFAAYLQLHVYLFLDTGDTWPAASVNARLAPVPLLDAHGEPVLDRKGEAKLLQPSTWLDQNRRVEQMTWQPGAPPIIRNRLISDGGWFDWPGCAVANLYRPPTIVPRKGDISPWHEHGRTVYPNDFDHIERWLAHRVQRPGEKINHALLLGGQQRIGKDTILAPVRIAVGISNFREDRPDQILGQFNPFLRSVILRVNEARDMGDYDRSAFYDLMKDIIASPPEILGVNDKNIRLHYIPNLCGVIITTNRKANGIHLEADDGRHYVAWSELSRRDWPADHFSKLWTWFFKEGGNEAVAYHFHHLDLTDFDPKAPPPQTPAFWAIVNANRAPEDAELADALDKLATPDANGKVQWPDVTTLDKVVGAASRDFALWLKDRKNARRVPHRFEECGYEPVRNQGPKDGLWKIDGRRVAIYGKKDLTERARQEAAAKLTGGQQDE